MDILKIVLVHMAIQTSQCRIYFNFGANDNNHSILKYYYIKTIEYWFIEIILFTRLYIHIYPQLVRAVAS